MSEKYFCMQMRINIDCNACGRKVRRIILGIKAIETHLIEKKHLRVSVCGRFVPADIAIKIRRKMNRRVEILDIEEIETDNAPNEEQQHHQTDQKDQIQGQGPKFPSLENQNSMFPSLEHEIRRPMFPSLANEYRSSFPSSRSEFALTNNYFPESFEEMDGSFWHYGFEFMRNRDTAFSM